MSVIIDIASGPAVDPSVAPDSGEAGVEIGQPLRVDERLEDALHFERGSLAFAPARSGFNRRRKPSSTILLMCVSI